MKLDIGTHEMTVTTETIQDVAYLKHMGYSNPDANIHLKVGVHRQFKDGEVVHITLRWEGQDYDSKQNDNGEFVQFVSGPMQQPSGQPQTSSLAETREKLSEQIATDVMERIFEGHIDALSVSPKDAKPIVQELVWRRLNGEDTLAEDGTI
jgi:hypothetical protein